MAVIVYFISIFKVVLLFAYVKHANGSPRNFIWAPEELGVYQTSGFSSDNVTSGPILIIDVKTIFIANLNYQFSGEAKFWIGDGKKKTSITDENISTGPLRQYEAQSIYLRLPKKWTTNNIDYIAIRSIKDKSDLGYVELYRGVSNTTRKNITDGEGNHWKMDKTGTIFPIPGCRAYNEISIWGTCKPVEHLKVFASNETDIDYSKNRNDFKFVLFKYPLQCPQEGYVRYALEENYVIGLIHNSSLLLNDSELLFPGSYCLEYVVDKIINQKIHVCEKFISQTDNLSHLYFSLLLANLIVSTLCFLITALIYLFILKAKDVFRKSFVGYSISMFFTFLTLICLHITNSYCNLFGGLFILLMICSFVWLTCLCLELTFVVRSFPENSERIYLYMVISVILPVIILMSSLIPDGIPDIPESFIKSYYEVARCYFEDNVSAFFTPIVLLLTLSAIALGYTCYIINKHNDLNDFAWLQKKNKFQFMLRSCFLVWVTSFIWLIETLANIIWMGSAAHISIDFIEALQGLFVGIIFLLNKYTLKEIKIFVFQNKNKIEQSMRFQQLLDAFKLTRTDTENNIDNLHRNA